MKKYLVEIREIEIYNIEVEVEDESQAVEAAWEILTGTPESEKINHLGSDGESEILNEIAEE